MASLWLSLGVVSAWADIELAVVSTAPGRPHFVAAGTSTTFVVSARNTAVVPATVVLRIQSVTGGPADWQATLATADALFHPVGSGSDQVTVTVPALQIMRLVVRLAAAPALQDGVAAQVVVGAWREGLAVGTLDLRASIRNRPKIYYVAIDGCGRGYLDLGRNGRRFDGAGERLMPRAWSFASRGARMTSASSVLPASSDPNHAAALTGSWAGTLGLFQVRRQYMGQDPDGHAVFVNGSRAMLRWGPDGRRVQAVFDVNKDPASGGAPSTYNALISGKAWLADLFRDGVMDVAADGHDYPDYVPAPQPYRLGDPPSDDDAAEDREGTNLGPRAIKHLFNSQSRFFAQPDDFPEDRWIAEATVRVIQAEDPDVLYVDLADTDSIQHLFGAADRPEEWVDPGTPGVLWDDENIYNRNANRDPVLDVVHEADWDFGLIVDALDARQAPGRSFVVLLSDHGLSTVMNAAATVLDPGKILLDSGVSESDVEWMTNRGESGFIALAEPAQRDRIESLLQAYQAFDPVHGTMVRPFVVINREEMDSGIDDVGGRFVEDGVTGNRSGELYSEWSIDAPSSDNSKVRWPDLFVFTGKHFQTGLSQSGLDAQSWAPYNGVHGSRQSSEVVLMMGGPGIQTGVYGTDASLADIAPTLYHLLDIGAPGNVNGRVLDEILAQQGN
jgi:arylsulfatase A-like enzyme